jgi:vacuolar-type H+-ATPase subunit H
MKKIIKEVLQVEGRVKELVNQARVQAVEIKSFADKDMSEKINQAKEETRQIFQAVLEDAKKQAEQLANEKIKQADMQKENMIKSNTDKIDRLVSNICKIILTTEYDMNVK